MRDLKIKTRPATIHDKEFILSLIPRLIEFGPPSWRDASNMIEVDNNVLAEKLNNPSNEAVIFIAEDDQDNPLGFIHVHSGDDYYNKEPHGHIGDIIIAPEGEGRGIGRILIEKAEEWARSRGFRWLTLTVFTQNQKAREVYKHLGFGEDVIKCVKLLD
jgi:ribosomal protein S18 acetylase RimI-like enzyme